VIVAKFYDNTSDDEESTKSRKSDVDNAFVMLIMHLNSCRLHALVFLVLL
jgi:hypothetical protein